MRLYSSLPLHPLFWLLVLLSAAALACSLLGAPPGDAPAATAESPGRPTLELLPDPEGAATDAFGAPSPTPLPPTETATEPPPATPTAEPRRAGPFLEVSAPVPDQGRPLQLIPAEDGLWLVGADGLAFFDGQGWQPVPALIDGAPPARLLGVDEVGRLWALAEDGARIAAASLPGAGRSAWSLFGAAQGWEPVDPGRVRSLPRADRLGEGAGGLWLSLGDEVRQFNGLTWQSWGPEDLDLAEPAVEEAEPQMVVAVLDEPAQAWVGVCYWIGPGPVEGGGLRVYAGEDWRGADSPLEGACVSALERGPDGSLWAGADPALWRYDPGREDWTSFDPPPAPEGARFGFTSRLQIDADGRAWPELAICGGASCFAGEALFRVQDGAWQAVGEPTNGEVQRLFFDSAGNAWLFRQGQVLVVAEGGALQPAAELNVLAAAQDPTGAVWLVAGTNGEPAALWRLEP